MLRSAFANHKGVTPLCQVTITPCCVACAKFVGWLASAYAVTHTHSVFSRLAIRAPKRNSHVPSQTIALPAQRCQRDGVAGTWASNWRCCISLSQSRSRSSTTLSHCSGNIILVHPLSCLVGQNCLLENVMRTPHHGSPRRRSSHQLNQPRFQPECWLWGQLVWQPIRRQPCTRSGWRPGQCVRYAFGAGWATC